MATYEVTEKNQPRLTTEVAQLWPRQGEWTEADYFALPDTSQFVELSQGELVMHLILLTLISASFYAWYLPSNHLSKLVIWVLSALRRCQSGCGQIKSASLIFCSSLTPTPTA